MVGFVARYYLIGLGLHLYFSVVGGQACSTEGLLGLDVYDTPSATALAGALANCSGQIVDVEWRGNITIQSTVHVQGGTILRIHGIGPEAAIEGSGQTQLFSVRNAVLHVNNMRLSNGYAVDGGAVEAMDSVLGFNQTSFVDNAAGQGGAIWAHNSTVSWEGDSRLIGNRASVSGGAVYALTNSNVTWSGNTTFDGNWCLSDDTEIRCSGGAVSINSSSALWEGQAIEFNNNSAFLGWGGAVYAEGDANLEFEAPAIFLDNTGPFAGGGLAVIDRSVVSFRAEVLFMNSLGGWGGAIFVQYFCQVNFSATTRFLGNEGTWGGAVTTYYGSSVEWAAEVWFHSNRATRDGGAIYIGFNSKQRMSAPTEFVSNHADSDGGAVGSELAGDVSELSSLSLNGTTIFANNTSGANGGALAVADVLSVAFEAPACVFESNSAAVAGGAVFVSGAGVGPKFNGVRFISNFAQVGGGVYSTSSGTAVTKTSQQEFDNPSTYDGCEFIDNEATGTGGAIESAAGVDVIANTVFAGNTAKAGGALRLAGTAYLENCSFVENSSAEGGGPAVSNIGYIGNVSNSSFFDNVFSCEEGYFLDYETSDRLFETMCDGCGDVCEGCSYEGESPLCTPELERTRSVGGLASLEMLVIESGYWRATNTSRRVLACYNTDACRGGVTGAMDYCDDGYEGPYCSVCSARYVANFDFSCSECSGNVGGIVVALVAGFVAVLACIAFLSYMASVEFAGRDVSVVTMVAQRIPVHSLKIVIVAWQILTQFVDVANITYPDVYNDFLDLVDVFNFDFSWLLSAGCVFDLDFHDRLIVMTVSPIICAAILGATYTVAVGRISGSYTPGLLGNIRRKHTSAMLLLTFLIYSSVSSTVFRMFACEELDDGKNYLRVDYRIECDSSKHAGLQIYAGIMMMVYPVGIPLFYATLLLQNRDVLKDGENRNDDTRVRSIADLWEPYTPSCYFYEVVECGRRILLTGVVVFIYPLTGAQIAVSLMIELFFWVLSEVFDPHASKWDTWISRAGHVIVFTSIYLALLLKVEVSEERASSQSMFEVILVLDNVFLVVAVFAEAFVISWALRKQDRAQEDGNRTRTHQSTNGEPEFVSWVATIPAPSLGRPPSYLSRTRENGAVECDATVVGPIYGV